MTETQLESLRNQNGGDSVEPPQEIDEATDEELSAAIAGIELEDDARSGSSHSGGSNDTHHVLDGDEPYPPLNLNDESDRTLDLETDESAGMFDRADDGPERTFDLDQGSDDSTPSRTETDVAAADSDGSHLRDTPADDANSPYGLRDLLTRIL